MLENALVKKLKLKPGQRAAIIHAPPGYLDSLQSLPEGVNLAENLDGVFDWLQIFVKNRAQLEGLVASVAAALKPQSLLWVSFPKGTSKIQTDLTRDKGWEALQDLDLKWVTLVSVNDTWSAFALRPYLPGEVHQTWR
jgi:hypothetical protein